MRQWPRHFEEVLANTLLIPRQKKSIPPERRSREGGIEIFFAEGWGGYSPIPPSHGYAIDIVLWGKINSSSWRVLINIPHPPDGCTLANVHPSSRWVYIGQCTPIRTIVKLTFSPGGYTLVNVHPSSRRVYIDQCTPSGRKKWFYYCPGGCTLANTLPPGTL